MRVPMMSAGTRSGVNCSRANVPPTAVASVSTARVLATPGTPSSSTCPRASSATSIRSTSRSWPTMTRLISNSARSSRAASTDGGRAGRLPAGSRSACWQRCSRGSLVVPGPRPPRRGAPSTGRRRRPGASVLHLAEPGLARRTRRATPVRPGPCPHPCPEAGRLLALPSRRAAPPVAARRPYFRSGPAPGGRSAGRPHRAARSRRPRTSATTFTTSPLSGACSTCPPPR